MNIVTDEELLAALTKEAAQNIIKRGHIIRLELTFTAMKILAVQFDKIVSDGNTKLLHLKDVVASVELTGPTSNPNKELMQITADVTVKLRPTYTEEDIDNDMSAILGNIMEEVDQYIANYYKCKSPKYSSDQDLTFEAYRIIHLFVDMDDTMDCGENPTWSFHGLMHYLCSKEIINESEVAALRTAGMFNSKNFAFYEDHDGIFLAFSWYSDRSITGWSIVFLDKANGGYVARIYNDNMVNMIERYKLSRKLVE